MTGLYIHIPFCEKKCSYCDFYSITTLNLVDNFVDALLIEIDLRLKDYNRGKPKINTVFFGGGTPSLLNPNQLEKIISKLKDNFDISDDAEWTMESNPATFDKDLLLDFRKLGINRLSIGVQSFNDLELEFLSRIHNADQAYNAIGQARDAGFDNINLDLIFSIPEQTFDTINYSIEKALEFKPEHLATYSLIYEPGTPLYQEFSKGNVKKIDDDIDAMIYENISRELVKSGYEHYEISNFALNGKQCIHNLNYWNSGEYFAFGPSAHGFLDGIRYWNIKSLDFYYQYLKTKRLPVYGREKLTRNDILNEKIFLGLRAMGINLAEFKKEFNIDIITVASNLLKNWGLKNLFDVDDNFLKLNIKGYAICNELSAQLISVVEKEMV